MKIYIKSESQESALRKIRQDAINEGFEAQVNKLHHCVDVFKGGRIVQQRYAEEIGRTPKEKHKYNYVGQNQGDYERVDYESHVRDYTSENPYIKYVRKTNR